MKEFWNENTALSKQRRDGKYQKGKSAGKEIWGKRT